MCPQHPSLGTSVWMKRQVLPDNAFICQALWSGPVTTPAHKRQKAGGGSGVQGQPRIYNHLLSGSKKPKKGYVSPKFTAPENAFSSTSSDKDPPHREALQYSSVTAGLNFLIQ